MYGKGAFFMGYCTDDLIWIYGVVFAMTSIDLLVCLSPSELNSFPSVHFCAGPKTWRTDSLSWGGGMSLPEAPLSASSTNPWSLSSKRACLCVCVFVMSACFLGNDPAGGSLLMCVGWKRQTPRERSTNMYFIWIPIEVLFCKYK